MRLHLQILVLQAHRERGLLARSVIEHRVAIDSLLNVPPDETVIAKGAGDSRLKHLRLRGASTCW